MNQNLREAYPEYIYYDVCTRNMQQSNSDFSPQLAFSESRVIPLLNCCNDYKMSIIRFELDTFSLPVFIPQIQLNQSDPNLMIQSLTLVYDNGSGTTYTTQQYLNWTPQDLTQSIPLGPNQKSNGLQTDSLYYYCYNFGHFIKILNNALSAAYLVLRGAVVDGSLKYVEIPYFTWNDQSQTASLYARNSMFNITAYPQIRIYFNRGLYAMLNSMPFLKNSATSPNGQIYQLMMDPNYGANITVLPLNNNLFLVLNQEYSTIANWSPISSIVFVTGTIPIVPNQLSSPFIYYNGVLSSLSSNNANYANIITDMSTDGFYQPTLIYTPTAEYRFVSLESNLPLSQIDISVYWKDKIGNMHPLYAPGGSGASLKILFQKIKNI